MIEEQALNGAEKGGKPDAFDQIQNQISKDQQQIAATPARPSRKRTPRETVVTLDAAQARAMAVEKLNQADAPELSTFEQNALGDQAAALLLAASPDSGWEFIVRQTK